MGDLFIEVIERSVYDLDPVGRWSDSSLAFISLLFKFNVKYI